MSSQSAVRSTAKNPASDFSIGCVCGRGKATAIRKCRSVARAVVVCLAALSAMVGVLQLCAQTTPDPEQKQTSGAPSIMAKPEQVRITHGLGSTEVQWDMGNGSMGFVF